MARGWGLSVSGSLRRWLKWFRPVFTAVPPVQVYLSLQLRRPQWVLEGLASGSAMERQHHPNMRVHERPAVFGGHNHSLASGLPFGALLLGGRQLHDVRRGVLQRDDRPYAA